MSAFCGDCADDEQLQHDWDIRLELAEVLGVEPEHVTDEQIEERRLGDPDDYDRETDR